MTWNMVQTQQMQWHHAEHDMVKPLVQIQRPRDALMCMVCQCSVH